MTNNKKQRLTALNMTVILETANALFLKKGVDKTTMDEIAREANYSKTTIYAYFKSKEDIFNHLIFEGMSLYHEKVDAMAKKELPFTDFYFEFCNLLVWMHDSHQVYFEGITGKIICSETSLEQDDILKKIYLTGKEIDKLIEKRLLKAISNKEIVIHHPLKETIMMFWFSLLGIIEKSALKESYLGQHLGKNRDEFLLFAFSLLLQLLIKKEGE